MPAWCIFSIPTFPNALLNVSWAGQTISKWLNWSLYPKFKTKGASSRSFRCLDIRCISLSPHRYAGKIPCHAESVSGVRQDSSFGEAWWGGFVSIWGTRRGTRNTAFSVKKTFLSPSVWEGKGYFWWITFSRALSMNAVFSRWLSVHCRGLKLRLWIPHVIEKKKR